MSCRKSLVGMVALSVLSVIPLTPDLGRAETEPFFNVLDLGYIIPGEMVFGLGLNDAGQVSGGANSFTHAFRTQPNQPINPATDDLMPIPERGEAHGQAINNLGTVVGGYSGVAFRTPTGSKIDPVTHDSIGNLGTPTGEFAETAARDINDLGQVVGFSPNLSGASHAFRTAPNSSINPLTDDLGTLGGATSQALAISETGIVVGDSKTATGDTHAFRTGVNFAINAITDDLGTLGGSFSSAADINERGEVVGLSTTASGATRAFLTRPNADIDPATDDLGVLPGMLASAAASINEPGDVVGRSFEPLEPVNSIDSRAFLWQDGTMYDLNALIAPGQGIHLYDAARINESGQILVRGFFLANSARTTRSFLLTPAESPPVVIPLPAAVWPGVIVLGAVVARVTRRKAQAQ